MLLLNYRAIKTKSGYEVQSLSNCCYVLRVIEQAVHVMCDSSIQLLPCRVVKHAVLRRERQMAVHMPWKNEHVVVIKIQRNFNAV